MACVNGAMRLVCDTNFTFLGKMYGQLLKL